MTPLEDLLQQCTVKITVPGGWGTGFFVAPGLILTCAHVVRKAADLQVTVVYPARQQSLSAIVKATADDAKTLDLALVELAEPLPDHPCVLLDEEPVAIGQALYSYGYLESYTNAAPVRPVNEGETGDTPPLLKLQGAQIERGISGAALLNLKTGKVCGMVKETRAAGFDLGGGAIPTRVILEQFPELRELQQQFHEQNRRWSDLLVKPTQTESMTQTNLGGRNYQTQTGTNNTNYIGETHIYNYATPQPEASSRTGETNVQPYLNSVLKTYKKWWQLYTLTDAEGKQRQAQEPAPMFDFGLMVQTVKKEEQEQKEEGEQKKEGEQEKEKEKVERFSVLDGLRKYALGEKPEPVLLVGRPGSGKSTALARLMLEEATMALTPSPSPKLGRGESERIPVLVELRYWQGSIVQLILNALHRHELAVSNGQLEAVLAKALLLFDGVNELPSEEARTQLSAFRHNHPKVPMIFTTRDLGLGGDLGIERKLEMQPLTEVQMQTFVRAYLPQEQAAAMLRQLQARLRELGQTPLLLWMLCSLFQVTGTIPDNLGLVFRAFTLNYDRQLKSDVVIESDRTWWQPVLQQLAWVMMQGEKPTELRVAIPRKAAVGEIAQFLTGKVPYAEDFARKCLRDLQKYHLIQAGTNPEELEFRHQLIQEYYAAEALLERLPGLSDAALQQQYLNYLKWTEPVALMLALCEDEALAVRGVQQALQVDLRLGARLAGEVKSPFQPRTLTQITRLDVKIWLKLELLERTGSDQAIPALLKAIEHSDSEVRWSAAAALVKIGSEQAIAGLLKAIEHSNSDVRSSATEALDRIGSEQTIPALLKAIEHSALDVRRSAAEALGEIGSDRAIAGLLKAIEDSNDFVRWSAAKALVSIAKNHLGMLSSHLPHLLTLISTQSGEAAFNAIQGIQVNCQFYNYELFAAHLAAQNADRPQSKSSDRPSTINQFPNVTDVKIFENVQTYHEAPPEDPPS